MKTKLIALVLLAGSAAFGQSRFSIGVGIGAPVVAARPFSPGLGYTWVDGYYDAYGYWINGYWAPPVASYGFAPNYNNRFYGGFGFGRGFDRDDFDRDDHRNFDLGDHRDFGRAQEFNRGHQSDRGRGSSFGSRR